MRHLLSGPCLHGGYTRVEITENEVFELLLHVNAKEPYTIHVGPENARVDDHLVSIGNDEERLCVVEHLFSAFYGLDMWGYKVDVFGRELPIFDGSALKFVEVLQYGQTRPLERVHTEKVIAVNDNTSYIRYEPTDDDNLQISMELTHAYIGHQRIDLNLDRKTYVQEIAPARTFVYTDESDPRLEDLPPYGFGITETNVYSVEPLRYFDEPVRHKVLDLLGDLFLLQKRLCGKIQAYNTYHQLNKQFVSKVLRNM